MRLLLKNLMILPMEKEAVIECGYIVIQDNLISEIGRGEISDGAYDRVIDGAGKVALPGFINTHTHAAMTLLRGYADDLPLMEWLNNKIWPMEAKLKGEDIYWGSKLAIIEMIKSGTTCFADMYFSMHRVAQAVEETGIRAVLARGMIGVGPEAEQAIEQSRALFHQYNGAAHQRLKIMLGPHAPYTCPPDYLKKVMNLAEELNAGIHIHLAETAGEVTDITKQYGKSPVALLEETGVFAYPVLAAHCVHLSAADMNIIKKHNVGVAHNPESNMKLASGIAPVTQMLNMGIPVALGTDGASSNNNLDMLQEMRTAALLQKVSTMDPTALPAFQALQMATVNGARALGLENEIGKLLPGFKADLILMDINSSNMIPHYNIAANLVYSAQAGDVDTVIIDGRIVMENRIIKTFSEEETLAKVKETVQKLNANF